MERPSTAPTARSRPARGRISNAALYEELGAENARLRDENARARALARASGERVRAATREHAKLAADSSVEAARAAREAHAKQEDALRWFHAQREKDLVDELKREQARSEAVEKRFNAVAGGDRESLLDALSSVKVLRSELAACAAWTTGGAGGAEGSRRGAGAGAGVAEPSADDAVYESLVERERSQGNEIVQLKLELANLRRKLAAAEAAAAAANAATAAARAASAAPADGLLCVRCGRGLDEDDDDADEAEADDSPKRRRSAAAPKPVEVLTLPKTQDLVGEILEKKVIADLLDEAQGNALPGLGSFCKNFFAELVGEGA